MDRTAAESSDRSRGPSTTRDVAIRESAPPIPRPLDHSRQPSLPNTAAERHSNDVWTSAISRLQAQVSYNTGMLESHRRQLAEIETVIGRMHHEVTNTVAMLNDVRAELRARPAPSEPVRHDAGDLDVLAGQLQRLTDRVNQVDGLSMQMDLMKNKMRRLEEAGGLLPAQGQRPGAPPARKEGPPHEIAPHQTHPPHPQQQLSQHPPHSQHPPLPPMRTASMASADAARPPSFPATMPVLESQSSHGFRPATESRGYPGEAGAPAVQPAPGPGLRHGEPLPPPSALSGWRPAEHYAPHGASPATAPHPPPPGMRPLGPEEPHGPPGAGWAAVNANSAVKRPPEETRSPYESPLTDGSKRPKLAPLMPSAPRSGYPEEGYGPAHSAYQSQGGTSNPSEASFQQRSRAPSDGSQPPSQPLGPTPAQQSLQHNFRFVTSSQQAEPPEPWRGEPERGPPPPAAGRGGRGRGRGRGGRGRGRGSRGGAGAPGEGATHHVHHPHHPHHPHHGHPHHGLPPEHGGGTPEWERPGWESSQASPNGHHATIMPAYSPPLAARAPPSNVGEVAAGSPSEHGGHEYPATPVQGALAQESYAQNPDGSLTSSGKKTRTKPIRNAEGILIRKDGRPDMRSVSSANNLRKVHAKKEAERMEMEDDDGTRSATPASAAAGEMDTSEEPVDNAQERHHELMHRIFPHEGGPPGAAVQYFPRHHEEQRSTPMKTEAREDNSGSQPPQPIADVVMGENSGESEERRPEEVKPQQEGDGQQERGNGDGREGEARPGEQLQPQPGETAA